ncbi:MAG: hypothetical protein FRX49_09868 [Trebouxia sp. A1-2]|nr:MAG: hypothetical protein FRX49_09868 [Trebouxia sp. A1-2]
MNNVMVVIIAPTQTLPEKPVVALITLDANSSTPSGNVALNKPLTYTNRQGKFDILDLDGGEMAARCWTAD